MTRKEAQLIIKSSPLNKDYRMRLSDKDVNMLRKQLKRGVSCGYDFYFKGLRGDLYYYEKIANGDEDECDRTSR